MDKDIRYLILKEYSNNSTSDDGSGGANKFLATLPTHIGTYDLGTVRRALIELIENDLLSMSNKDKDKAIDWLKDNIITTRKFSDGYDFLNAEIIKSSERLLRDLDNPIDPEWSKKIPIIRVYTTISGVKFLKEWRRFKYEIYVRIGFALFGFALALLLWVIKENVTPSQQHKTIEYNIPHHVINQSNNRPK